MKKILARTLTALAFVAGATTANAQSTATLSTTSKIDFSKITEQTQTVRMSRQFFHGYNTICLPFSLSSDELTSMVGDGVVLERLVQAEEGTLTFLDVTADGLEAGMPYLIFSPKKQYVTFTTKQTNMTQEPQTINVGIAMMGGKYEPSNDYNLYGIPAQQDKEVLDAVLVRTSGDKTFYPTRCYISYKGDETPVVKHVQSFDEATAIKALQASNKIVDIYTTSGQILKKNIGMNDAMSTLKSGVYVVNGMKFIVK